MTFEGLLQNIEYSGKAPEGQARFVTQDSRKVSDGAAFVCIQGRSFDGHEYAAKALKQGAGMIVTQRELGIEKEVVVEDTRLALAAMCQNFFGNPGKKLKLIGVTGTNGKTTVTNVIRRLMEKRGIRCGLIGSIQNEIGKMEIPARFTTPEAWDIAALQSRMVAAGCTHAVLEASSQAIEQGRLAGQHFALGIFTNLSRDHLDYHGDMEQYFQAKKELFTHCDVMLTNLDDEWGERLLKESPCAQNYSYSTKNNAADFSARNIDLRAGQVRFGFLGDGYLHPVVFPMPGDYSVYNALSAAAAVILMGEDSDAVAKDLAAIQPVRGRCEVVYDDTFTVIRDFAHTADGIDKLLGALKPFVKGKMKVVYGCTGQRDAVKRVPMGEAVVKWADEIALTADNPRMEDQDSIFADARRPLEASKKPFFLEADRELAIQKMLAGMSRGDLLVLCGKGHEDYQVMDGYTVYLDEAQVVRDWMAQNDHSIPAVSR